MAKERPAKPKASTGRGRPWSRLANAMIEIGKDQAEAVQIAWGMWFEYRCPITWAAIGENKEALKELFEQSSGQLVDDSADEEEETGDEESPPDKEE